MSVIKLKGFEEVTSRNLQPSWEVSAEVIIGVLKNPKANAEAIIYAEDQVRHLAKIAAAAVAEQEKK